MTPEQEDIFNHYKRRCALYGKVIQKLRCKYGNDEINAITQEIDDYEQGQKEAERAEEMEAIPTLPMGAAVNL